MYELHRLIDKEPDYNCDDPMFTPSIERFSPPMVEEFSPVVVMLVKAGLITMSDCRERREHITSIQRSGTDVAGLCLGEWHYLVV